MKFKLNDNVKMLTDTHWWNKGDTGQIVRIDDGPDIRPYLVLFDYNSATDDMYKLNPVRWWAKENEMELARSLMTVE